MDDPLDDVKSTLDEVEGRPFDEGKAESWDFDAVDIEPFDDDNDGLLDDGKSSVDDVECLFDDEFVG